MDTKTTFKVYTANPELSPQLAVYEILRGEFDTLQQARDFAQELIEQFDCNVQVRKCAWQYTERDCLWINAAHAKRR